MRFLRSLVVTAVLLPGAFTLAQESGGGNGNGRPPRPPQEAFDACSGLETNASCTVTFDGHEVKGTCRSTPDSKLVCAPAGGPPGRGPGSGQPPPEPGDHNTTNN